MNGSRKPLRVAILPGDGTGPELIKSSLKVLNAATKRFDIKISAKFGEAGLHCMDKWGTNLPNNTISLLRRSDCVIKGPMTTPEGAGSETSAAVKIRKMFNLYADVRLVLCLVCPASFLRGAHLHIG